MRESLQRPEQSDFNSDYTGEDAATEPASRPPAAAPDNSKKGKPKGKIGGVSAASRNVTTSRGPSLIKEFKTLYQYRALMLGLVKRELKVRYKNSILGFVWSFINPLIAVVILTYVFQIIQNGHQPNYSAYLLAGYLPYQFFSTSLMDAAGSVTGNMALVSKIYFPREILPIAAVLSNLVHFMFGLCVFFTYLLLLKVITPGNPFVWTTVYIPIIIVFQTLFIMGLGLFFCAINTFFEDIKFMLGAGLWLLFFLTPVMWFVETFYYSNPRHYKMLSILNPNSIAINAYRKMMLPLQPVVVQPKDDPLHRSLVPPIGISWVHISYFGVISVLTLVIGYAVFNRLKWRFAERP